MTMTEMHDLDATVTAEALVAGLKAAGEHTRLRILFLTAKAELTVTELTQILGQTQPRVSRHLKLLCDAGLIERFREGTWVFYRAGSHGSAREFASTLVSLIPGGDWISADLTRLETVKRSRAEVAAAYFRANASEWNKIRSMHVAETEVEAALTDLLDAREVRYLLDVGTGTGRVLELMGPRVIKAWGVDLSREMLAVARDLIDRSNLRNCHVRLADMYRLPFSDHSMDLVTYHQVLHFADDPASALVEGARVLCEGGSLLVADFAPHEIETLRSEHAHRRLGFSETELSAWLKFAGLKVKSVQHLSGDPLTVTIWAAERSGGLT